MDWTRLLKLVVIIIVRTVCFCSDRDNGSEGPGRMSFRWLSSFNGLDWRLEEWKPSASQPAQHPAVWEILIFGQNWGKSFVEGIVVLFLIPPVAGWTIGVKVEWKRSPQLLALTAHTFSSFLTHGYYTYPMALGFRFVSKGTQDYYIHQSRYSQICHSLPHSLMCLTWHQLVG